MMRLGFAVLCVACMVCPGCQSAPEPRDYTALSARIFLEAANTDGTPVTLPQSGVRLSVNSKPVITEGDIVNVELVQVDLGKCLLIQLTPTATRDFYRMSVIVMELTYTTTGKLIIQY